MDNPYTESPGRIADLVREWLDAHTVMEAKQKKLHSARSDFEAAKDREGQVNDALREVLTDDAPEAMVRTRDGRLVQIRRDGITYIRNVIQETGEVRK